MTTTLPQASRKPSKKPWLHRLIEKTWYQHDHWSDRLVMWGLLPLVPVFCLLGKYRRWQHIRSRPAPPAIPIIVIGNITVGGTGKTPLVIYLADLLKRHGYRPAIISRGYGGQAKNWPQNVTAASHPHLVGDEPVLMATHTHVPVVVGADRNTDIQYLLNHHHCDVILSDDGLQHYRMPRNLEILVLDGKRGFGNGWCLPAGPLREPQKRWQHGDFRIINGESTHHPSIDHDYTMQLVGTQLISLNHHAPKSLKDFAGQTVHAVSGIGHPERFFKHLSKQGLQIIPHSFPDHHLFHKTELCFNDPHAIIMTEKDAVKCRGFSLNNAWYLPVEAQLPQAFEHDFLKKLRTCIAEQQH